MTLEYVITFIVASLATYRIADTLARDEGPMDIFKRIREWPPRTSSLAKGLKCPFCLSFWVGLIVALVLPFYGFAWYIVTVFALSAITSILLRRFG